MLHPSPPAILVERFDVICFTLTPMLYGRSRDKLNCSEPGTLLSIYSALVGSLNAVSVLSFRLVVTPSAS
jgi:hypothetical protein